MRILRDVDIQIYIKKAFPNARRKDLMLIDLNRTELYELIEHIQVVENINLGFATRAQEQEFIDEMNVKEQ